MSVFLNFLYHLRVVSGYQSVPVTVKTSYTTVQTEAVEGDQRTGEPLTSVTPSLSTASIKP